MTAPVMTVQQATDWLLAQFTTTADGDGNARADQVAFLLSGALGMNYSQLRQHADTPLPTAIQACLGEWAQQLHAGRPVQYVLGQAPFMADEFVVDERVLIPRPETELLVDWLVCDARGRPAGRLLDVGTGSGAIAISALRALPGWQAVASDLSVDALTVADTNAARLGVAERWQSCVSDVYASVPAGPYDIIVSNPPYISPTDQATVDASVDRYEPHSALYADDCGLAIYRRLAARLSAFLAVDGVAYVEIGHDQGMTVPAIFAAALPEAVLTLRQDYAGHDRMLKVQR